MPRVCATCVSCEPIEVNDGSGIPKKVGECRLMPRVPVTGPAGVAFVQPRVLPLTDYCTNHWSPRAGYDDYGRKVEQGGPKGTPIILE